MKEAMLKDLEELKEALKTSTNPYEKREIELGIFELNELLKEFV